MKNLLKKTTEIKNNTNNNELKSIESIGKDLKLLKEKIKNAKEIIYEYIIENKELNLKEFKDEIKYLAVTNKLMNMDLNKIIENETKLFLSRHYDTLKKLLIQIENNEKILNNILKTL